MNKGMIVRNKEIAYKILVEGKKITEVSKIYGVHQVTARSALHQYCKSRYPEEYQGLCRLKNEVGGFKYYYPPELKAMREASELFFTKKRRYLGKME